MTEDMSANLETLIDNLEHCKFIVAHINSGDVDEELYENVFELISLLSKKFDTYNQYICFDNLDIIYSETSVEIKETLELIRQSFIKFYEDMEQIEHEMYYNDDTRLLDDFKSILETAIVIQNKMLYCYQLYVQEENINTNLVNTIENLKI